jgi:hypothetical protein
LASREGILRLAMRNYNDNKIVLTSGSDIQRMLNAYSLQPEMPVMKPQVTHRVSAPAPRAHPFQVEIYRNGKSSESMSFIREASLGAPAKSAPRHRATFNKVSDNDVGTPRVASAATHSNPPVTASATESAGSPASEDADAAGSAPHAPGAVAHSASFTGAAPEYVPTPKTIDVP